MLCGLDGTARSYNKNSSQCAEEPAPVAISTNSSCQVISYTTPAREMAAARASVVATAVFQERQLHSLSDCTDSQVAGLTPRGGLYITPRTCCLSASCTTHSHCTCIAALLCTFGEDWHCYRGHASEKPELPRLLNELGIIFLGPREAAMAALGDKIASSILAQAAGVPTLPWSGSGVSTVLHSASEVTIPEAVYTSACVQSLDEALASCREIGYPVMIKVWLGQNTWFVRSTLSHLLLVDHHVHLCMQLCSKSLCHIRWRTAIAPAEYLAGRDHAQPALQRFIWSLASSTFPVHYIRAAHSGKLGRGRQGDSEGKF
jgi:hypothetical protein